MNAGFPSVNAGLAPSSMALDRRLDLLAEAGAYRRHCVAWPPIIRGRKGAGGEAAGLDRQRSTPELWRSWPGQP